MVTYFDYTDFLRGAKAPWPPLNPLVDVKLLRKDNGYCWKVSKLAISAGQRLSTHNTQPEYSAIRKCRYSIKQFAIHTFIRFKGMD